MKKNPRVSVVIPAFNYAHFLGECIDSVLNQTMPCEVIVVNDGSTDNTEEICLSYGDKIKYVFQENQGLVASRNNGIKASSGEYIMCLDADDYISVDYVQECVKLLDDGFDIACCNWIEFFDDFDLGDKIVHLIDINSLSYNDFLFANRIICSAMFKRDLFFRVGMYDDKMRKDIGFDLYEDWFLWLKMLKEGARIGVSELIMFFYRKHGVSMISKAQTHHSIVYEYMLERLK